MALRDGRVSWSKAFRLALTLGILWGAAMWLTAVVASYTVWYAHAMVAVFGSIYYGYGPTWGGAFLGLLWGFLDLFGGTLIAVALYNALARTPPAARSDDTLDRRAP